jgi:hypothetical protein
LAVIYPKPDENIPSVDNSRDVLDRTWRYTIDSTIYFSELTEEYKN